MDLLSFILGVGFFFPSRKGPTGGWVERREKKPTLIESFYLPLKIDCLRRSPRRTSRSRRVSIVGVQGFTPLPWESEGGWARIPRGGAWGETPIQQQWQSAFELVPGLPLETERPGPFGARASLSISILRFDGRVRLLDQLPLVFVDRDLLAGFDLLEVVSIEHPEIPLDPIPFDPVFLHLPARQLILPNQHCHSSFLLFICGAGAEISRWVFDIHTGCAMPHAVICGAGAEISRWAFDMHTRCAMPHALSLIPCCLCYHRFAGLFDSAVLQLFSFLRLGG